MTESSKYLQHKIGAVVPDRISELGDDILVSIINRLNWKEATSTSVLSTRWRHLHTRISRLTFPPFCCDDFYFRKKLAKVVKLFRKYIDMIDHTLDSYAGGTTLKEFRAHMYILKGVDMKRWVEFALAREVEILDIRMEYLVNAEHGYYRLQIEKLSRPSLAGLKCLRELSLAIVDVDDGDFAVLLSNSPNLESLSLEYPQMLRNVSVIGHPKLKHFHISDCEELESIEMENLISLVSLKWHVLPRKCVVRVNNVPNLIEFSTADEAGGKSIGGLLFKLPSCILSQLLFVRLMRLSILLTEMRRSLPELINVKHLDVAWNFPPETTLVEPLVRLIEACRSLEKFEMKVKWFAVPRVELSRRQFVEYFTVKKCSPHLKKVKLWGYLGSTTEWEVAAFIIKYAAPTLQKVIVQLCDATKTHHQIATDNVRNQLTPIIPNSVNLVIN